MAQLSQCLFCGCLERFLQNRLEEKRQSWFMSQMHVYHGSGVKSRWLEFKATQYLGLDACCYPDPFLHLHIQEPSRGRVPPTVDRLPHRTQSRSSLTGMLRDLPEAVRVYLADNAHLKVYKDKGGHHHLKTKQKCADRECTPTCISVPHIITPTPKGRGNDFLRQIKIK